MALDAVEFGLHAVILGCLAWASWIDLRSLRLPNALSGTIAFSAFILAGFFPRYSIISALLGLLVAGGLMLLCAKMASQRLRTQAMGAGDIKFAAAIGAWVGVFDVSWMLLGAALIGLLAFALRPAGPTGRSDPVIPFGPCLAFAGALVAATGPSQLLQRYWIEGLSF